MTKPILPHGRTWGVSVCGKHNAARRKDLRR